MIRSLLSFLVPLRAIAAELALLRELYTLDLSSRTPPVVRLTEKPNRKDTEVFYGSGDAAKPAHKQWDLGEDEDDMFSEG